MAKRRPQGKSWFNREVFGWAMFDFANQAFTLVILTTMYQLYFVNHVVVGDEIRGRTLWATSNVTAQLIVLVISPLIGALADFSGAKKRLLLITYVGCVAMTAALGLVAPGDVVFGMLLFIVGYLFFATGENFLAAFLPELCAHRDMGKVSGFGFTLGYFGGLLCLAGAVFVGRIGSETTGYRLITLWAALFFLAGAMPTFFLLRERKQPEVLPAGQTMWTIGFHRVANTFRSIRHYKHLFRFLAIMTFYLAGMQVVIFFGGTIATKLFALSQAQLGAYITLSTVCAIGGAFTTALYQDRIGTRNTILIALGLWAVIMLAAVFIRDAWRDVPLIQALFWIVGGLVGFGMGMLGTASRAMVGLFSPAHKAAEFFGFYGLAHKGAASLGLVITILAEQSFGQHYNLVVATSGLFFVGGFVMMLKVDERAGRTEAMRTARAYERQQKKQVVPVITPIH
jgi:UMF1 family MFS transporter